MEAVETLRAPPGDGKREGHDSLMAEISRQMVRIYKEQFGRGPTKAKSTFADADTLVCTLEDSLTKAERKLVEMGEDQRVGDLRTFFQHSTEREFRAVVEGLTERKVRAFVSGMDTGMDVSSEVFYLEPRREIEASSE